MVSGYHELEQALLGCLPPGTVQYGAQLSSYDDTTSEDEVRVH